jgi:hypothetical protein
MKTGVKTSPWGSVRIDDLALLDDPTISNESEPVLFVNLRFACRAGGDCDRDLLLAVIRLFFLAKILTRILATLILVLSING